MTIHDSNLRDIESDEVASRDSVTSKVVHSEADKAVIRRLGWEYTYAKKEAANAIYKTNRMFSGIDSSLLQIHRMSPLEVYTEFSGYKWYGQPGDKELLVLIHAATMFVIACRDGVSAAVLWKLANDA